MIMHSADRKINFTERSGYSRSWLAPTGSSSAWTWARRRPGAYESAGRTACQLVAEEISGQVLEARVDGDRHYRPARTQFLGDGDRPGHVEPGGGPGEDALGPRQPDRHGAPVGLLHRARLVIDVLGQQGRHDPGADPLDVMSTGPAGRENR